jgi:hypothetical protein
MSTLQEKLATWEARSKQQDNSTCDKNKNITCDKKTHVISFEDYKILIKQLELWNVQYRHYILKNYPQNLVIEAIERTVFKQPNNPGAYFRKVLLSLAQR